MLWLRDPSAKSDYAGGKGVGVIIDFIGGSALTALITGSTDAAAGLSRAIFDIVD
jgi:hypothetical protein